ncbi:MBL fold metallo-hydrolase [Larsenimonas suaedae]|uniref:MBL fold metallo-hydrolase n=1 Tax=Larsenimonas suaedae TaxID=1851019 RepID=A0ABU1GRN6_9GAMM|nr:MBL fold metallo-hydrolase [Larsenimonas suaedae]MCM2972698.1 MBL fold metallo-hydrolase [Larsenimonas suaedae]MDR5894505.1 MBL fold metallo-hydrolase [Larsenimonas suaedae]
MSRSKRVLSLSALTLAAVLAGCSSGATSTQNDASSPSSEHTQQGVTDTLTTQVFNPGEQAIFAVSSVLVEGKHNAILIDAQFSAEQAQKLADQIRASGRTLTTIYISHGDPDYYFGLDTLHKAFPEAKIVATPQTIAHIKATMDEKMKVWGPQLGENAPEKLIVPEPLNGDTLMLEGKALEIEGLNGPTPERTFVWIPSIKTVAGGIPVVWGEHVWMADTQTPQSHADWLATLDAIRALAPDTVIPGHFVGSYPKGLQAVDFTADYIRAFDKETAKASDSSALIKAMNARYPTLGGEGSLELSAKVAMGEMEWH